MHFCKTHFDGIAREALAAIKKESERAGMYSGAMDWADVEMQTWSQEWPDTRCGFNEDVMFFSPEITAADTAVFKHIPSGLICVTHNHRIAYMISAPNREFYEHFKDRWLCGKDAYSKQYEEE